jgi:chromate reductase, NAD(P)H dehydrogenase (quinone)
MKHFHILAISGSLRKQSYNSAALRAAQQLAPGDVKIALADISAIPLYNDDLRLAGLPASVVSLGEEIATADAVMIATPEYNYSIPGVLKNAIDWVSKIPDQPFSRKPVAILGASMGAIGTARSQYDLRKVFVFLNAHVLNQPEIMIASAQTRFDADGNLTDEKTRELIAKQIVALKDWALRLRD